MKFGGNVLQLNTEMDVILNCTASTRTGKIKRRVTI